MNTGRNGEFESSTPSAIKSIKQRDLLNTWLRLYAGGQRLPKFSDYQPERMADEAADLVYYKVESGSSPPRITIDSDGSRIANAYGRSGISSIGQDLIDYIGAKLAPVVMPIYYECISRELPVFTISRVVDSNGRPVDYERLLLPFADGAGVDRILASLKTISEEGSFEIRNLMRTNDALPVYRLRSVIDRDLFHARPVRKSDPDDTIEFS